MPNYETLIQETDIKTSPSWLAPIRKSAQEKFKAIGFPSSKHESWKYNEFKTITEKESLFSDFEASTVPNPENITLLNGRPILPKKLPEGVKISLLSKKESPISEGLSTNPFSYLNTQHFSDGIHIKIPKNELIDDPIMIDIVSQANTPQALSHPRIFIESDSGSAAMIGIQFISMGTGTLFSNTFIDIRLEKEADLRITQSQYSDPGSRMVSSYIQQKENSTFESIVFVKGGTLIRHDTHVALLEEGAHCDLKGIGLLTEKTEYYNHLVIQHKVKNTTANQHYKNILTDQAKAEFCGLVHVEAGSHEVKSEQLNQNLVLSDSARALSRPQLIIDADDVECSHGCTVGQLNPEEVFYIQSRGLSEKEAKTLLTYGFVEEILETIPIEPIRESLEAILNTEIQNYVHH